MKLINRAIVAPTAFAIVLIGLARAEIIPAERRIDWGPATVGVPGGIPDRPVIFAAVTQPPYNADKTGAESATAAIQSAINACPQNQVVYLPAGTYKLTSSLTFGSRNHITLRGAGMGKTILKSTRPSAIRSGSSLESSLQAIVSGATKGSTGMVVSDAAGVTVGKQLTITQANNPELIWSRAGKGDLMKQRAIVTSVNGNTIGFSPPLAFDFDLNPRYSYDTSTIMRFNGLEDFTIDGIAIDTYNVWLNQAYACWIKNVESTHAGNVHFFFSNCLRLEVRRCYAHHTSSSNDGYGIEAYSNCTGLLIEDNIFAEMGAAVMLNQTVGSVVGYNFGANFNNSSLVWQFPAYHANHGPHGIMTLWEGNVGQQWQNDGYHGSTSHQTIFRNWFHGHHDNFSQNRKMLDLTRFSYYHNVVGNILGSPLWNATEYELTGSPSAANTQAIYRLGYPNMGNNYIVAGNPPAPSNNPDEGGDDPNVAATLLRHGNFDYFNDAIVWDPAIADRSLPDSLYHPGKPGWFGEDLDWPPFDPANPAAAAATNIPAGNRYINSDKFVSAPKPPGAREYWSWIASFGLAGADAAEKADPDGDGRTNESEFGTNTDPTVDNR